jgi:hypothetical protein
MLDMGFPADIILSQCQRNQLSPRKTVLGSPFGDSSQWQNLSIPISENVRVGNTGTIVKVTIGGRTLKQRELMRKDI